MNYYNEIKEQYDRVKDYSKDRHKVRVYYEIGRLLNEAGKEYEKNIMNELFMEWKNFLKYLVMKNWTHWVQNWVGAIIDNY